MRELGHMVEEHRYISQDRAVSASEQRYEPPRVEVVVTGTELERESLYAGTGGYGIT